MAKPHLAPYVMQGNVLITSGQLAYNDQGIIEGDITEQTTRIIQKLETLVASQGFKLTDIHKTTVWLTNRDDSSNFNSAYAAAFGDHRPARSTTIAELIAPGAIVEIEAVAWLQD